MKKRFFGLVLILAVLTISGGVVTSLASARQQSITTPLHQATTPIKQFQFQRPLIADHTRTDITAIPQARIEQAKNSLHIAYGHTSHGSQLTSGMSGLVGFANNGGLGLDLPDDIFAYNHDGNGGGAYLHLFEGDGYGSGDMDHDCGYYPNWVNETTEYLGPPDPQTGRGTNHPEMNVIIWSWCGQASGRSEQEMLDTYLLPMTQLESDYHGIVFVYMTGHADGSGEEGNLHQRNQQIRQYCIDNDKVLYDFYDIELYDPDGAYYGDKLVNDACDYDSDGNGTRDRNWATDWQGSHVEGQDWYSCSCAHSQDLNCNRKAYAVWWLWANLAGWNETMTKSVTPDTNVPYHGTVTYTLSLNNSSALSDSNALLTDTLPIEVDFVQWINTPPPGTDVTDDVITWSGTVTAGQSITFTFQAAHTAAHTNPVTNTAEFSSTENTGSAQAVFELAAAADLQITKSASPNPVLAGGQLSYTLSISNASPAGLTVETITVNDELPAGVSLGGAGGVGWACSSAGQFITCTTDEMPPGPAPSIVITASAPLTSGPITNTAAITSTFEDPELGNNTSSATVIVIVQNAPPLLDPIGDQVVDELVTLTFTATASDPNDDDLSFSLDAGAPAGASIDPASGVFTWTPSEAQGPGVYPLTVRVTDNGAPPLDDAETITVTVNEVCTAISGVTLAVSNTGSIYTDTLVHFTADLTPAGFDPPYSYTLGYGDGAVDNGSGSANPLALSHTYAATGSYEVQVSVWNCDMTALAPVSDTIQVTVREQGECVPLNSVAIAGPTSGYAGEYNFSTAYLPTDASLPITYLWDDGGADASSTRTLGLGVHTLTVTANNCYDVTVLDTHVITISQEPITCTQISEVELSLEPPGTIDINIQATFNVDISPDNFSVPYSYTIDYGDGTAAINDSSSDDPLTLQHTFAITGDLTVAISVWNCDMTEHISHTLQVTVVSPEPSTFELYLPIVIRND